MAVSEGAVTERATCSECDGTGLYHRLGEPDGVYVTCAYCGGKGWAPVTYTPFKGRKRLEGVIVVQQSARGLPHGTGVGPIGPIMTYEEFLEEYPEDDPSG